MASLAMLAAACAHPGSSGDSSEPERLIGTWRLVEVVAVSTDGRGSARTRGHPVLGPQPPGSPDLVQPRAPRETRARCVDNVRSSEPPRTSETKSEHSLRGANDPIGSIGPRAAPSRRTVAASCGIRGRPSGLEPLTPGATVRDGPPRRAKHPSRTSITRWNSSRRREHRTAADPSVGH
jgi:hypothetical protein